MKKSSLRNMLIAFAVLSALAVLAGPAGASPIVYEGFQYGVAGADRASSDLLNGQPDGTGGDINATGLGGTWQDSTAVQSSSDMFLAAGSLAFGDMPTSGNHVRGDSHLNNDIFSRPITASLPTSGELWVSFLANKLLSVNNAAEGGLVIGNQAVNNAKVYLDTGSTGLAGFGIAPPYPGNSWTAYVWDGSSQSAGDADLSVATDGSETHLLVGKISFDTGTNGADEFTFYEYQLNGGSIAGGSLSQVCSTLEVDLDQATIDTLTITRQVNVAYDEIRIGQSLNDVLPEPATLGLLAVGGLAALRRRKRS